MKKAYLVGVSPMTRIIVDKAACINEHEFEEKVKKTATWKLVSKIINEFYDHLEVIEEDLECPYDPDYDDYYQLYDKSTGKIHEDFNTFEVVTKEVKDRTLELFPDRYDARPVILDEIEEPLVITRYF